jgi:hypothetical protein
LIKRIQSHNIINGVGFAPCEFALIAVVVAPFALFWAFDRKPLYALVATGIIANYLCVIGLGVQAWRAGERGYPLRLLFSGAHRASLSKQYPKMSEDTLILSLGTLILFGLTVPVLFELLADSRRRSR